MAAALEYSGLRELIHALKEVDVHVIPAIKERLEEVGEVIRREAQHRFESIDRYSAQGFETRVRPGSEALVVVGTRLRSRGTNPDWGALLMTKALLPARSAKFDEAAEILENRVGSLLHQHGF